MGRPAAKHGDHVVGVDTHLIQFPGPTAPVPVSHPFDGQLVDGLSANVFIEGRPAATLGSVARNSPPHIPIGGTFVNPPTNEATVLRGSATVLINGRPAARTDDPALSCSDRLPQSSARIVASSTVLIGG